MLEEHKSNLLQVAPAEDWRLASAPRNGGSGPTVDFWLDQESHGILSPQPEARGFTVTREQGGVVRVTLAVKNQAEATLVCSVTTVNCVSLRITLTYKCASRDPEKELRKW